VSGGDWLCDQDAVQYFVEHCTEEMVQLEHWGCPWSRHDDGSINVRFFGGMKVQRTWFAADKSGFHILHTLFQTSLRFGGIQRYDEFFVADLLVDDGRVRGVLAIEIATGQFYLFEARAVILATGGAGRVYRQNTNAGIVTGDGMALAFRHGVALRDMEFVQYHPTALPGTGILITEGCRGEGAILTNKHGYRYLQDYGLGPLDPWPRPKAMELGPRDRLSQAFWHEERKGNTIATPQGHCVHLDLRHLGAKKIHERLPLITEVARTFLGVDPVTAPIPVRPAVHYTMGGIHTNRHTQTALPGLYAAGECASVGIHGANRLGSNSLAEIVVFGKVAGEQAAAYARGVSDESSAAVRRQADDTQARLLALLANERGERVATLRDTMGDAMEAGVGIYRQASGMQAACAQLAELRARWRQGVKLDDHRRSFNTEWLSAIELGAMLEVAEAMAHAALQRQESRGAHVRLDGFAERDDTRFLVHSLAQHGGDGPPVISHEPVNITTSPPRTRHYGGAGESGADMSDDSTRTITLECLRFDPEADDAPRWQRYEVPFRDDMSVLQGLQHIKDHLDGSLTFRWSCRMAICGSCGMMINGVPQLACHAFLRDFMPGPVRVEPLNHFPILRDLVIDQNDFLDKLESVRPYLIPAKTSRWPPARTARRRSRWTRTTRSRSASTASCVTPPARSTAWTSRFTGPAALALLHRYNADSRDQGWAARADIANAEHGVWELHPGGLLLGGVPQGRGPGARRSTRTRSTARWTTWA
jgi:fumarate reductase flavoprotein subunit